MMTPRGRGAVATVQVRGEMRLLDDSAGQLFLAANGRTLCEQPIGGLRFGHWAGDRGEEVVVCRRDDRTFEIHCHGGDAAVGRVLADLERAGCRIVPWREQSIAERGLFETECLEALSRAPTLRTADILLNQQSGVLRDALHAIERDCGLLIADCGLNEIMGATGTSSSSALIARVEDLLSWAEFGRHLTEPWKVVLAGRPNVGKSSLINALLGYARSIVFDEPGTTRDVVTAQTAFQGWPVQLADTAGLRAATGAIEAEGVTRARAQMDQADCCILVLDSSQSPAADDWSLIHQYPGALIAANKSDLADRWEHALPAGALRVSALTGAGVEALSDAIVARLVPREPTPETAVPVAERQAQLLEELRRSALRGDWLTARRLAGELLASTAQASAVARGQAEA